MSYCKKKKKSHQNSSGFHHTIAKPTVHECSGILAWRQCENGYFHEILLVNVENFLENQQEIDKFLAKLES